MAGDERLPPRAAGPGRGVRIGVLDTRLYPQPWLAGGWAARYSDTLTDFSQTLTAEGHATFVTGLILRQAPGATVEVRGVLDEDGTAYSWDVAKAMVEFGRSGLDILNLSFSCYTEDGEPPLVLSAAVDRLPQDVVVVAAAGNHGSPQDADGNPRSSVATLLNGTNGTLYSAIMLSTTRGIDLLNDADKTIPPELGQMRSSFMTLNTARMIPTLTPTNTLTPTITPTNTATLPVTPSTATPAATITPTLIATPQAPAVPTSASAF